MNNKIKFSLLSLSLVGCLASCDLDAEQQSSMDASKVFSIYTLAESEVMSIHISFCETNSYRGRFTPFYGMNNDVETMSGDQPDASNPTNAKQQLYNYDAQPDNTQMNTSNNAYAKFYEGIERANLAIENLRIYGDIENNPDMAQLLGEALTLRALIYTDLIKAWGDVPARFVPNNNDNIYLPRTNRDSIYKVLLADLEEAEQYCYWPNENTITSTTERVSKSFVKGLRARIALYACGYGLRGDGFRRSKDSDLSEDKMMAIAQKECTDVINAGYNTLGTFEENFRKLCQDDVTAGGESIWEIPFSSGRGRVLYTWGIKHDFPANSSDQYTSQPQGGVNGPMPYLYYDYDVEDTRRDITCIPYEWGEFENGKTIQTLRGLHKWCFGKLRYEWMKPERALVLGANDDGINWQYMRLADIYLMAAEAENYINGPSTAWTYMKPVLDRVLPAAKVSALQAKYTASKDAFQDGIVEQRGFEFAGEALRKADLIRWGIIDEKMEEAQSKLRALRERSGVYADLPQYLYYKLNSDGESISIYGLNHGDTDDEGDRLREEEDYERKGWFLSDGVYTITDNYINGLYHKTPSEGCLWPIWKTFIDTSNGMLNNDGIYGQLSD